MAAGFAICYLLAAAAASWAAVVAAVVWGLAGGEWMGRIALFVQQPAVRDILLHRQVGVTAITLGSLTLFLVLSYAKWLREVGTVYSVVIRRALPVVLFLALFVGPKIWDLCHSGHAEPPSLPSATIYSSDRSRMMTVLTSAKKSRRVRLDFTDRRTGWTAATYARNAVTPIAISSRGTAYLAQQLRGEEAVRVLAWDSGSKRLRTAASVPARENALAKTYAVGRFLASVSPEGRYVLLTLQSQAGMGVDVWVVDQRERSAWIAFPNTILVRPSFSWLGDRLAMSGLAGVTTVSLRSKQIGEIRIPKPERS